MMCSLELLVWHIQIPVFSPSELASDLRMWGCALAFALRVAMFIVKQELGTIHAATCGSWLVLI